MMKIVIAMLAAFGAFIVAMAYVGVPATWGLVFATAVGVFAFTFKK